MSKADDLKSHIGDSLKESAAPLPRATIPSTNTETASTSSRERDRRTFLINTDSIKVNPQVREHFNDEEIEALAQSMATHGQLQAVIVFRNREGDYQLVAGERRLRAAKRAQLKQLRCELFEGELSPERILELQMVENLLRVDLNPLDEARGYLSLMEQHGWSMSKVAQRVGKNKSTVSRSLKLLTLPDDLIEQVAIGEILPRLARELARLDDVEEQRKLAQRYSHENLTSEDVAVEVGKQKRSARHQAVQPVKRRPQNNHEEDLPEPFIMEYQTKHAKIRVEFDSPNPSKPAQQVELLAAVKWIGRQRLE